MSRDAVEEMLDSLPRHRLADHVPRALRRWLLPIAWDRKRLWSLDLPIQRLPIDSLCWHLALPWWRDADGAWFQIAPVTS